MTSVVDERCIVAGELK